MRPDQPLDLVLDALDMALAFSSCEYSKPSRIMDRHADGTDRYRPKDRDFFRQLLVLSPGESRDLQRPPLVELLCGYLKARHPEANDTIVSNVKSPRLAKFA